MNGVDHYRSQITMQLLEYGVCCGNLTKAMTSLAVLNEFNEVSQSIGAVKAVFRAIATVTMTLSDYEKCHKTRDQQTNSCTNYISFLLRTIISLIPIKRSEGLVCFVPAFQIASFFMSWTGKKIIIYAAVDLMNFLLRNIHMITSPSEFMIVLKNQKVDTKIFQNISNHIFSHSLNKHEEFQKILDLIENVFILGWESEVFDSKSAPILMLIPVLLKKQIQGETIDETIKNFPQKELFCDLKSSITNGQISLLIQKLLTDMDTDECC